MEVQFEDFLVDFINWGSATEIKLHLQGDGNDAPLAITETVQPAVMPVVPRVDSTLIKPAKSRNDQYEATFSSNMLCSPYKYDLKITGELDVAIDNTKFTLDLVDAETRKTPSPCSDEKPGVQLDYVEISGKDAVLRFALLWCSFRFKKRAFRLKVSYKGVEIFVSPAFHTYARRRGTPYNYPATPTCGRQFLKAQTPTPAPTTPFISNSVWSPVRASPPPQPAVPAPRALLDPMMASNSSPMVFAVPASAQNGSNDMLKAFYERTQMAIQVMSALSPYEREAVNYFLNCNNRSH